VNTLKPYKNLSRQACLNLLGISIQQNSIQSWKNDGSLSVWGLFKLCCLCIYSKGTYIPGPIPTLVNHHLLRIHTLCKLPKLSLHTPEPLASSPHKRSGYVHGVLIQPICWSHCDQNNFFQKMKPLNIHVFKGITQWRGRLGWGEFWCQGKRRLEMRIGRSKNRSKTVYGLCHPRKNHPSS
jgi:hypothetical protein